MVIKTVREIHMSQICISKIMQIIVRKADKCLGIQCVTLKHLHMLRFLYILTAIKQREH